MKNLVLTGFMGSGKSYIGGSLSSILRLPFVDSDLFATRYHYLSVTQIFGFYGEHYFRRFEDVFVDLYSALSGRVISTGGGMGILGRVRCLGTVFYLEVSFDTVVERIGHDLSRPLFDGNLDDLRILFNSRRDFYVNNADYTINSDRGRDVVLADILHKWGACD